MTWFNSSADWGAGGAQIGPGTAVHLCGVISSNLTVQGSGASGTPITILFEPNAKLSQLAFELGIDLAVSRLDDGATGLDAFVLEQLDAIGADTRRHNLRPQPAQ